MGKTHGIDHAIVLPSTGQKQTDKKMDNTQSTKSRLHYDHRTDSERMWLRWWFWGRWTYCFRRRTCRTSLCVIGLGSRPRSKRHRVLRALWDATIKFIWILCVPAKCLYNITHGCCDRSCSEHDLLFCRQCI